MGQGMRSSIPHRTSQNLCEKVSGHVCVTFCRHCMSYNIHHVNIPVRQKERTRHTVGYKASTVLHSEKNTFTNQLYT